MKNTTPQYLAQLAQAKLQYASSEEFRNKKKEYARECHRVNKELIHARKAKKSKALRESRPLRSTKTCSKCTFEKPVDQFEHRRRQCLECRKKYRNERSSTPQARAILAAWMGSPAGKKSRRAGQQKYDASTHGKAAHRAHEQRPETKEYRRKYRTSPERVEIEKANARARRASDIEYKLRTNLRSRLYMAVRDGQRDGSAVRDLGCTVEELVTYLGARFFANPRTGEPMNWGNWTREGWHIDHIRPLASFDLKDRAQSIQANHYTNLQPLWAKENFEKSDTWEPPVQDASDVLP